MKKLLLLLTVFFTSSSLMADVTSVQQTLVGTEFIVNLDGVDVYFTITDDGDTKTAKVGRKDGDYSNTAVDHSITQKSITIPQTVKYNGTNYTVTAIGNSAFYQISALQEVVMPSTIETIEDNAFTAGDNLTTIEIPASVTSIGYHAFLSCSKLVHFTVSKDNPKFDSRDNCNAVIETASNKLVVGIINSTIPATVTTIGQNAFCNNSDLHITIPATVTAIEHGAFSWCHTSVFTVESSTPLEIDENVFYGFDDLSRYCFLRVPDGAKEAYLAAPGWNKFPPEYVLEGDEVMEFTEDVTTEGETVSMSFSVTDRNAKTVKVGQLVGSWEKTAVSSDITATSITVPETITHAGVKYTVTAIGDFAFCDIINLQHLTLPSTITSIGNSAFYLIPIQEMTLPTAVTSIGMRAFGNCYNLKNLEIPANVKTIGIDQFHGCTGLESLTVAQGNDYYESPDGCNAIIEKATHKLVSGTLATKSIPTSVIEIGDYAFSGVQDLILTIPSKVRKIGFEAFWHCNRSILTVEYSAEDLPDIDVDANAFSGADDDRYGASILRVPMNTKGAYMTATGWSVYKEDNILEGNEGQEFSAPVATGNGSAVDVIFTIISDGQTKRVKVGHLVGNNMNTAVSNETFATFITIPETVTHEGTEYTVTSIGDYAFHNICIKGIALPSSITAIGSNAFRFSSLTSLEIPAGVTTIGNMAFFYCDGLSSIVSKIEKPFAIENAFSTTTLNNATLTVPAGTKDLYLSTDGWKDFSQILYEGEEIVKSRTIHVTTAGTLPDLIANNEKYVLEELTLTGELNGTDFRLLRDMAGYNYKGENTNGKLKNLDLSGARIVAGGEMYIDATRLICGKNEYSAGTFQFSIDTPDVFPERVFQGCKLENVTLPQSITKINYGAFSACFNLKRVTIPSNVSVIDDPFYCCTGMLEFVVDAGNENFSSEDGVLFNKDKTTLIAYPSGKDATTYQVPTTVKIIDQYAFNENSHLTSIILPEGLATIRYYAFRKCQLLTSISIPSSVNSLRVEAFDGCVNLSQVMVSPDNIIYSSEDGVLFNAYKTEIIFYPRGKKATSYTIPNSVATISDRAFENCSLLSNIEIPKYVRTIGSSTFYGCTSLESLVIHARVSSIGILAFYNCKSLTSITSESANPFDIDESVFDGPKSSYAPHNVDIYSTATLYVPTGTKALYQSKTGWSNFKNIEEIEIVGIDPKRTIHVATAGTLPDLISQEEKYEIEELTLTGELNGTDFRLLRDMAGNNYLGERTDGMLKVLDFSGAKIVAGGEKYLDTDRIHLSNNSTYLSKFYFSIENDNELPQHIFHSCKLTSVSISNEVTTIGVSAFEDSPSLSSVTIPYGVKNIGRDAFRDCNSLSTISIPQSVTSIGSYAFGDCKGLTEIIVDTNNDYYCSDSGVLFNKDKTTLILYPQGKTDKKYIVPGSVTRIEGWAFVDNHYLSSVTIPSSVTFIGGRLFDCDGLTKIFVDSENSHFSSIDGVLFNKDLTTILRYPISKSWTHYTVPSTVTSIGNTSFSNCRYLASVELPNSVRTIEDNAFFGSKSLTSIHLSTSLATIGSWAFDECGLTTITIPNSVTSIKDNAFVWCNNLTSVIVWRKTPLNLTEDAFPHRANATLYVPAGCIDAYTNTDYWKEFKDIKENPTSRCINVETAGSLPDLISEEEKYEIEELTLTGELNGTDFRLLRDMAGCNYLGEETGGQLKVLDFSGAKIVAGGEKYVDTNHIGRWGGLFSNTVDQDNILPPHVFMGCKLTSVNISATITAICDWSFALLNRMTSITIPNTTRSIGSRTFQECSSLTSITIPSSITSIADDAFMRCYAISSINVENGNTVYDSRNNCNAIIETSTNTLVLGCGSTIIPDNISIIGNNAFLYRDGFTSLVLPSTLTKIGVYAFGYCTSLTSVTIPDGVTSIDAYAFEGCSGIQSLNIPSNLTTLGFAALRRCSGLTSLTIPKSLTSIGDYAFQRCNSLTSIEVDPDNEHFTSESGIMYNKDRTSILCYPASKEGNSYNIPNTVTVIGKCAFGSCSNLTSINLHQSITTIDNYAFEFCSGLTSITIPGSVTSIGDMAFYSCDELSSIISGIVTPFEIRESTFSDYTKPTLKIPFGSKEKYQAAEGWKNFEKIEEMPYDPSTEPENIVFASDAVKTICVANWDTNNDGEFNMDEAAAVTDLGTVFKNNQKITSFDELQYFTGLTSIGKGAFLWCSNLTSIIIPKSVTYIDNGNGRDYAGAFSYCYNLTSIVVEEGNPVYDSRDNCNAIIKTSANELIVGCKTTVIPSTVTRIGNTAFYGNYYLYSITIPEGVTSIGHAAFNECWKLSSVKLPNSLTEIGNDVFHDDSGITSITIPSGVTFIGDRVFFDCNGMISVTSLAADPIDISKSKEVFAAACSIYENATLKVPFGSKAKYQAAGGWKDFVNIVELGDVNGDNMISITDAVAILDFLSDKEPENFNVAVADMDGDGEITVSDAILILNMILNGQ